MDLGFDIGARREESLLVDQTPARVDRVRAKAWVVPVRHGGEHMLEVFYVVAENGERWVEARAVESSSTRLRQLEGRRRLTVARAAGGLDFCELRLVKPKGDHWTGLYKASLDELTKVAAAPVATLLRRAGAVDVGKRELVLGDTGRQRSFACVTFEHGAWRVPLLAFLLTRVAPLIQYEQKPAGAAA